MKVSVYIAASLDGFIARKNGDLDWLPGTEGDNTQEEDYGFHNFFDSVDALLMGKNTFEKVVTFGEWYYGTKPVYVASKNITIPDNEMYRHVQVISGDAEGLYNILKSKGLTHIYLDGGMLIQSFLRAGLVDEMIISTIPVLIGEGIPLFGTLSKDIKLMHESTESFDGTLIQSKYKVVK